MNDEYLFIITVVGISLTFAGSLIVYFLRSKCNTVSCCWGGLQITRDIENELKEELVEMEHGHNPFQFDHSETKK
jgi:hypothetical protein